MLVPIYSGGLGFWRVGGWRSRDSGTNANFRIGLGCVDLDCAESLCQVSGKLVVAVACVRGNVVLPLV